MLAPTPSFEDFAYQHDWFMHCPSRSTTTSKFGRSLNDNDDGVVTGCECACPKAGDLQGRKPGQELVDMGESPLVESLSLFPYSASLCDANRSRTPPTSLVADTDWRYSCISFWKDAVRKAQGEA